MTVLAASGDAGATDYQSDQVDYYTSRVTSWPDSDPLVTAVGGTQLRQQGAGYKSVAWNDTYDQAWTLYAGGSTDPTRSPAAAARRSSSPARPTRTASRRVTGARRGVPDIAMSAACDGSVNVYSSLPAGPGGLVAVLRHQRGDSRVRRIVALADQVAGHPLGLINPALYRLAAEHAPGIVDVTSGNNTVSFHQGATRSRSRSRATRPARATTWSPASARSTPAARLRASGE